MKIALTKTFTTETSHRLKDYPGDCLNIHGHTYKWEVTVLGPVGDDGMVMDFKTLKRLCKTSIFSLFDHSLVVSADDPIAAGATIWADTTGDLMFNLKDLVKLKITDGPPTAENLLEMAAASFKLDLMAIANCKITNFKIRVWETRDSYATTCWEEVTRES